MMPLSIALVRLHIAFRRIGVNGVMIRKVVRFARIFGEFISFPPGNWTTASQWHWFNHSTKALRPLCNREECGETTAVAGALTASRPNR